MFSISEGTMRDILMKIFDGHLMIAQLFRKTNKLKENLILVGFRLYFLLFFIFLSVCEENRMERDRCSISTLRKRRPNPQLNFNSRFKLALQVSNSIQTRI